MAVKRHAIGGTLSGKVRHIYDITRLYAMDELQQFLNNKIELKKLLQTTKSTDSFYLEKRKSNNDYNPLEKYDFSSWEKLLDQQIKRQYENLHVDLLYTNEKQDFYHALEVLHKINLIFLEIDE